jgi:hypothetical protein
LRETIFQADDLHRVATASLAIWAPCQEVAWEIVQTQITREAQQPKRMDVAPGCPAASGRDLHTRPVRPQTLWGEGHRPGRTFQGGGGAFTDDVRALDAPEVAEQPPRVAHDRVQRGTGGR